MGIKEALAKWLLKIDLPALKSEIEHTKKDNGFLQDRLKELKEWLDERDKLIEDLRKTIKEMEEDKGIRTKEMLMLHNISLDANKVLNELQEKGAMTTKDIKALLKCRETKAWMIMQELKKQDEIEIGGTIRRKFITLKKKAKKTIEATEETNK